MEVPLTTVTQNAFEIGREAAQLLLERLEGSTAPPRCKLVPTRLQIRMSTSTPMLPDATNPVKEGLSKKTKP